MLWLLLLGLLALVFGPSLWVRHTLKKYAQPADRYGGTGAELARHLLDLHQLQSVKVETTGRGDHYDPIDKAVRLSSDVYDRRSLTAVTIAAHEVGHALQDAGADPGLRLRTRIAPVVGLLQKLAMISLIAAPIAPLLARHPWAFLAMVGIAFLAQLLTTIFTFITLPVEWDASFGKALPMLQQEGVLIEGDLQHARSLLRAAALTYVASSMVSLIFLVRWLR